MLAALLCLGTAASVPAPGQDTIPPRLPPVVVTRDPAGGGRSPFELPYAITTLRPGAIAPGQTHTQVEQTLGYIPGLTVANRANPSQDARVSIRGFGARSPFGVRSIRVLRDGMPLTLPDGQTPIDYLDLEAVGHVETIRGTASALYGNASGGVVDLRTAPAPASPATQARTWFGSHGMQRHALLAGGTRGATQVTLNAGRTTSDGFRARARQRLTNGFLRAATTMGRTELAVTAMGLDMPLAENPGALTRAQFDSAPTMADPINVTRNARKEVRQTQAGISARRALGEGDGRGDLHAQVFGGTRVLRNPLAFAVVDIDRWSSGAQLRATMPVATGRVEHRISAGVDGQRLDDARRNWVNCNGVTTVTANCPAIGAERGRLRINQREVVTSVGPYLRTESGVGRARATLGARYDATTFEVRDAMLADGRDDSGRRSMRAVSPMAGLAWRFTPLHSAYGNVSTAFETPTTTELGNQSDGSAGLNTDLDPQYSTTVEVGTRGIAGVLQYDLALFSTGVRDELIQFEVPGGGGRTYFRNAGRTRRRGVEGAIAAELGAASAHAAYTFSHFRFREFRSGTTQAAGNAIPGIPEHQLQAAVTWRGRGFFAVGEWLARGRVFVNDANAASAPGYSVVNLRGGFDAALGRPWLRPVVGVQNLLDRAYAGSVAVNAAGTLATAKFYEPAPRRTWIVGLSAATAPW